MKKLNIIFFGTNSRYTKTPLLEIASKHNIIAILESAPRNHKESLRGNLIRKAYEIYCKIQFIKSKEIATLSLKQIATKLTIPYFFIKNFNSEETEKEIKKLKPDLICVASLSQLLGKNIIDIPKYGIINMHPSYLPFYKGANPWFWQYYNMEKEGGVTIHYIDEGEDTGDIIYQKKYPIKFGMKSEEMWDVAIPLGSKLMLAAVDDIAEGRVKSYAQGHAKNLTRARNVISNEKIVDWENWDIERIYHVLQGTYTWLNSIDGIGKFNSLSILGYEKIETTNKRVFGRRYVENHSEVVYCKDGIIYIKTKFSLKKMLTALT